MELNDYIASFADQFEDTDPEEITATTRFHDLDEWDSLVALAVLNMSEKKYGKRITFAADIYSQQCQQGCLEVLDPQGPQRRICRIIRGE